MRENNIGKYRDCINVGNYGNKQSRKFINCATFGQSQVIVSPFEDKITHTMLIAGLTHLAAVSINHPHSD